MSTRWKDVLRFWFGEPGSGERGRPRKAWFVKSPEFDAEIRDRFFGTYEQAEAGQLDAWQDTPLAALALVVVLDQFPRNMFRGIPRAFATDARALAVARGIVERGFDVAYVPVERAFAYLPFEHAEDIAMQRRSLALFAKLPPCSSSESYMDYARRHHDVIARFGRFPHRNEILGRASTPEEKAFLNQPGSTF
ncbi:MAG: DUF924 domain-containing protein [Betaproteobacteria bacterium]|nr:DUF924 domain-containing protein [Betaproteobacteria bacterium]